MPVTGDQGCRITGNFFSCYFPKYPIMSLYSPDQKQKTQTVSKGT